MKYYHDFFFSLFFPPQETKESIVYRMLDKLASVELLESTLKMQIRPYIEYCGLNADVIFAQYVKVTTMFGCCLDFKSLDFASWNLASGRFTDFSSPFSNKIDYICFIFRIF